MTGPNFADAIASIESGGNYGILGPSTKGGDRAYGKYQVMGSNIGPWSQEILGTKLTPQQFLQSPEAQDAVFHGKFNQYVDKYGPEGAARAWFAGPGGMNNPNAKDVNGMTVGQYAQRFTQAMAPPLGTTNIGGPPLGAPQAPQLPAVAQPQQQQLPAPASPGGATQPQQQQMLGLQIAPMNFAKPRLNLAPLQQVMSQFPAAVRGYSQYAQNSSPNVEKDIREKSAQTSHGWVRYDENLPEIKQLLQNLPPDMEIGDQGGTVIRVRKSPVSNIFPATRLG